MNIYKLYKFREVNTNSLTSLANAILWFSSLKDFNDPFEGILIRENDLTENDYKLWESQINWTIKLDVSDPAFVKLCNQLKLDPSKTDKYTLFEHGLSDDLNMLINIVHSSKFLCMSQKDQEKDPIYENLMWSHYAQGLCGFCLAFNNEALQNDIYIASAKRMRSIKVTYQNKPNKISLSNFLRSDMWLNKTSEKYIQTITETISTKSTSWKYENEVRIVALDSTTNSYSYSPESLKEIILGERMSEEYKNLVISIAKSKYPNVKILVAKLVPGTFKIEICDYIT